MALTSVKFWNVTTRIFILRVARENLDIASTGLIFMTQFAEAINELAPAGQRLLAVCASFTSVEL